MKRISKTIVTLLVVMVMVLLSGVKKAEASNKYPTSKQKEFCVARDNGEKWAVEEEKRIKKNASEIKENREAKADLKGISWKSDVKIARVSIYHPGDRLEDPIFSYQVILSDYIYFDDIITYSHGTLAGKKIQVSFEAEDYQEVFAIEDIVLPIEGKNKDAMVEEESKGKVSKKKSDMQDPGFANPILVEPKPLE